MYRQNHQTFSLKRKVTSKTYDMITEKRKIIWHSIFFLLSLCCWVQCECYVVCQYEIFWADSNKLKWNVSLQHSSIHPRFEQNEVRRVVWLFIKNKKLFFNYTFLLVNWLIERVLRLPELIHLCLIQSLSISYED